MLLLALLLQAVDTTKTRAIHDRVMTLDTHIDINPANFTTARNYTTRQSTQVDLPKMESGGLDAAFFIVYVGQDEDLTPAGFARARAEAMAKFAAIHRLTDTIAPSRIGLATTAADARRIYASGRKVALIGVENAYPVGTDITTVRTFAELGARYMSLAHNGHNHLSDSNTGERDNTAQRRPSVSAGCHPRDESLGIMVTSPTHPSSR
jgi:membrane dipeptidase